MTEPASPIPAIVRPPPPPLPDNPSSGTSFAGTGVSGQSNTGAGVRGQSFGFWGPGRPTEPAGDGVFGEGQNGVHGRATIGGAGVWGENTGGGYGVSGSSASGEGVFGQGRNGVHGESKSATDSGVWGENTGGGYGVSGVTQSSFVAGGGGTAGVWGHNNGTGTGVKGTSSGGDGVFGGTVSKDHAGVSAYNGGGGFALWGGSTGGTALWAGGTPAGHFEGDVEVTGDIRVYGDVSLINQDCAEDFEISCGAEIDPGTVMVITTDGALEVSQLAYDNRVAGVVSGAGNLKPGIILGRHHSQDKRLPIALLGKVCCKIDAGYSAVEVGDLLTSSPTPGHAMKADDRVKAFGAVLGKALGSLKAGRSMIPILVALQ